MNDKTKSLGAFKQIVVIKRVLKSKICKVSKI